VHRPQFEVAQIVDQFGQQFVDRCQPKSFIVRTLDALQKCRTSALGGHIDYCDCCGEQRISYNSCGNRHCPKCQGAKQALWVEDRMNDALDCKYFHIFFTVPEELNQICLLDSNLFYKTFFESAWNVLQQFGYTKYSVESGAICVLHTWGQNLSLHPHIHCIVPAAGLTLAGNLRRITKNGKYLYPVLMLSPTFRSVLLKKLKLQLKQGNQVTKYQILIDDAWKKPWIVYCKPPFGNAQQIVKYLGQYSHRVAISNHRIKNISGSDVTFFYKDYRDESRVKPSTLSGVEFLRRFCMHILPKRFVKIRYYGILSSRQKDKTKSLLAKKSETKVKETRQERIVRLTGFDYRLCPVCKTGFMHTVELLPKIRAPTNVLYAKKELSC
jgi:hypothetical protein